MGRCTRVTHCGLSSKCTLQLIRLIRSAVLIDFRDWTNRNLYQYLLFACFIGRLRPFISFVCVFVCLQTKGTRRRPNTTDGRLLAASNNKKLRAPSTSLATSAICLKYILLHCFASSCRQFASVLVVVGDDDRVCVSCSAACFWDSMAPSPVFGMNES